MRAAHVARDRAPARGWLAPRGARVVLGGARVDEPAPLAPAAGLFGPRGVCLAGAGGPLAVCDTGHHRLLVWGRVPEADDAPPDLVIGQRDRAGEARNAGGTVGAATLNMPTGIAAGQGVLAVADAWNHRVLLWHGWPSSANRPADIVLGQPDTTSAAANRGLARPRADTLNWCFGVAIDGDRLFVADTGNRRVLVWDGIPTAHGAPADLVLGQADFGCRDLDAGGGAPGVGMAWPHMVAADADRVLVADAGMHRIMVWNRLPGRCGAPCDVVLGQPDHARTDANRLGGPTRASLSQPYGVALTDGRVVVADTGNSRLLGFAAARLRTGADADALAGQAAFDRHGENRWGAAGRDTLSWPYGIAVAAGLLAVADTGNNRVLLWDTA